MTGPDKEGEEECSANSADAMCGSLAAFIEVDADKGEGRAALDDESDGPGA